MEESKRTTTLISHLSSSIKNKQKKKTKKKQRKKKKKKERYHLMTECLLFNNTSNRFKFIMTPTRGKTCGLRRRNGIIALPSQKPRTVDNMLL